MGSSQSNKDIINNQFSEPDNLSTFFVLKKIIDSKNTFCFLKNESTRIENEKLYLAKERLWHQFACLSVSLCLCHRDNKLLLWVYFNVQQYPSQILLLKTIPIYIAIQKEM